MPDYFSHAICAQKIYEKCPRSVRAKIDDVILYKLGAQGGDIFFAYSLKFGKQNPGVKLHDMDAEELFSRLKDGNISYAAGFATHYALDCTLHPAVYAFENASKTPFAHVRFEADLGLYISRKYAITRRILPRERILSRTGAIYDSIVGVCPQITMTGTERCLKRHFAYTRGLIKSKRNSYAFAYDYASLSGAVEDAVSLGAECVAAVVCGDIRSELFSLSFLER